jgi:hypothetical protein
MAGLFLSNFFLLSTLLYQITLALQISFYAFAIGAVFLESLRNRAVFYFPYYFCSLNLAAGIGLKRFIFRQQTVNWEKILR